MKGTMPSLNNTTTGGGTLFFSPTSLPDKVCNGFGANDLKKSLNKSPGHVDHGLIHFVLSTLYLLGRLGSRKSHMDFDPNPVSSGAGALMTQVLTCHMYVCPVVYLHYHRGYVPAEMQNC